MKLRYAIAALMLLSALAGCGKGQPTHEEILNDISESNRKKAEARIKFEQGDLNLIYTDLARGIFEKALPDRKNFEVKVRKNVPSEAELNFQNGDPEQAYDEAAPLFKISGCVVSIISSEPDTEFTDDEKRDVLQAFADRGYTNIHIYFPHDHNDYEYYIENGEIHIEPIPGV
ncbi:MAG: hypothetical protein IJR45_03900 [Firmicutes bacterium]|nr:hypothetical protein [Bacillota bacterium]MBQ9604539.1 hypothetical protein [Bacillota bacterium]